jgi:hypothetical protein
MSNGAFKALMLDFAKEVGLPDPEQIVETGQFKIDEFQVALFYDERLVAETIFAYIDFGEIAAERERDAYRAMLESNLIIGGVNAGVLGVHPDTGHAIFSFHLALTDDLNGRVLAQTLEHYVEQAQYWQKEVLSPEPKERDWSQSPLQAIRT